MSSDVDARTDLTALYLRTVRNELERRYRRMRQVVSRLTHEQLNWRPHAGCNSIANLVVHFSGNIGERYLKTLGGQAFERDRPGEFATDVELTPSRALEVLDDAFPKALAVLDALPAERLSDEVPLPSGHAPVLDFIVQTLAHYAEHVGQAIVLAKQQGVDVGELPT